MKKIISFIIAFSVVVPSLVFAQVTGSTSGTKTVVNTAQLTQLLTLLEQELAFLEQEYNQLAAAQASTTQELAQVSSSTATLNVSSTSSSTLGEIANIIPTVTQTSTISHPQNNTITQNANTQPTQQVAASAPAPVQATIIPVTVAQSSFQGASYKQGSNELIAEFLVTPSSTTNTLMSSIKLQINNVNAASNMSYLQNVRLTINGIKGDIFTNQFGFPFTSVIPGVVYTYSVVGNSDAVVPNSNIVRDIYAQSIALPYFLEAASLPANTSTVIDVYAELVTVPFPSVAGTTIVTSTPLVDLSGFSLNGQPANFAPVIGQPITITQ